MYVCMCVRSFVRSCAVQKLVPTEVYTQPSCTCRQSTSRGARPPRRFLRKRGFGLSIKGKFAWRRLLSRTSWILAPWSFFL